MGARVRSVNVGAGRTGIGVKGRRTGIDKRPVDAVEVRDPGPKGTGLGSGVVGDDVLNGRHHGGSRQALYAVAREELDFWSGELGRELADGCFGENLTTEGLEVDAALVGERWRVGETLLEVTGPRVPCANFAAWMGERAWVKRFVAHGRSGAYLAVVEPGTIRPGDRVEVVHRPAHGLVVPVVLAAWFGDVAAARTALDSGAFEGRERAELERVATRG
ncbi:MOSC domain-containing protein [Phycicoccus sp.]|uniref:MOSC domain-containing protein n=1 Tax=Phycicoccus sp. TaxID=1902410 RepID=UPI002CAAAAF0|nr:MOSC domain-containing protein [Phycicoccus sp.]HMM93700.1 MOSC domain-containing protein [Phycicoccus sp.]